MKISRKNVYLMCGVLWQYFGFNDQPWGAVLHDREDEYKYGTATASDQMMQFWVSQGYATRVILEDL